MICPECGTEFFSKHWNAKFCNVRCKNRSADRARTERAQTGAASSQQVSAPVHGAALEARVREAERLERRMRGEPDPDSQASIFAELYPKKKD